MTGNPSGKRELKKQPSEAGLVLADIGIDLAVRALEVRVGHHGRPAVPRTGDVDHVQVVFLDDSVQVRVDEVLPRRRPPVSEKHSLHIRQRQGALQERVVVKINLADRQVVGRAPVRIDEAQLLVGKPALAHGRTYEGQVSPGASSITSVDPPRFRISSRRASGVPVSTGNVPQCIGMTRGTFSISHASAAPFGPIV